MKQFRQALPNFLTSLGLSSGLASVICTARHQYEWGAWLILWSALFDKADGTIAKRLNVGSRFGAELDSLSDFLSFGLAPAFLLLQITSDRNLLDVASPLGVAALAGVWFYVLAAAIRLAHFNVMEHPPEERYFQGLPTTSCGILVGAALAVFLKHRLPDQWLLYALFVLPLLGLAMISRLPVPKVVRRRILWLEWFQRVNMVVLPIFCFARIFPEYILALIILYLIMGVGHGLREQRQNLDKPIDR